MQKQDLPRKQGAHTLGMCSTFLLDMDGTLYLGEQLLPGAKELLAYLNSTRRQFFYLTNNSSKDKQAYVKKLKKLGLPCSEKQIFSSADATTLYLRKYQPKVNAIYLLGNQKLRQHFLDAGFNLCQQASQAQLVVVGFDTELTYDKLWQACEKIKQDGFYVATHPDYVCPLEAGRFMPDAGSISALIEAATGVVPEVVGKPNQLMIEMIKEQYQIEGELAMVGDRLYTDIELGNKANIISVLVLSGETTIETYLASKIRANYIFANCAELLSYLHSYDQGK